jgi:hypothetical protein
MSKTHSKDSSIFSDIASTTIAGQLESRMKELERNIAVAHEFIKLADESYSQVRRDWQLLQQDSTSTRKIETTKQTSFPGQSNEDTFEEIPSFKEKRPHTSNDKKFKTFSSSTSHAPSLGSKPETPVEKDIEDSIDSKTPEPIAPKDSKGSRHRKGKHQNSKN